MLVGLYRPLKSYSRRSAQPFFIWKEAFKTLQTYTELLTNSYQRCLGTINTHRF